MNQISVKTLTDPSQVHALSAPLRVSVLDALREPDSAAGVARAIGLPRQKANYHVKALVKAGLVRHTGERRKGNFVEQLYQAVARRFVVAPQLAWDVDRLSATLADQVSLAQLSAAGERLTADAAVLLDAAAFRGRDVPSATADVEVRFADEATRAAFLKEYLEDLQRLLQKYGTRNGAPYRLLFATYPDPEEME